MNCGDVLPPRTLRRLPQAVQSELGLDQAPDLLRRQDRQPRGSFRKPPVPNYPCNVRRPKPAARAITEVAIPSCRNCAASS